MPLIANAGDKIVNGGGLWGCINPQGQLLSAKLVDLFEAEQEFGYEIPNIPSLMAQELSLQKARSLGAVNAIFAEKMGRYLNEVFQKSRFVDSVLEKVDDALFRITPLPSTC